MAGLVSPAEEIKQALARKEADAAIMADLRERLDALVGGKGKRAPTRPNLIALIQTLIESLRSATDVPIGVMPDGAPLVTDHPAIALLDTLADMLHDLDRGKPHIALKRAPSAANNTLSTAEMRERDVLLEAVDVMFYHLKFRRRGDAEKKIALELKKRGKKFGGEPITTQKLKSWRDHRALRK